ncbi:MAG: ABC transporter permease [Gemmatimonadaceae bacterium]|nr:ABC transporter permease [Gemmatimonadaceae bacterium]
MIGGRSRAGWLSVLVALASSALLLFLVGPVLALVGVGGGAGAPQLLHDAELRRVLGLTALTATGATLLGVLGGTPLAWLLARRAFRGRALLSALLDLPLVLPHPVAGIALLLVLGRESVVGGALLAVGLRVVGSPLGIIVAMLFVSAPLYVSGAREAFAKVDPRLEGVARTLGDTPMRAFQRVTFPLAFRGLLASAVVMWARAVSEFGAVVVLAYNPKVASVLSYDRLTTGGLADALPVAAVLAVLALLPLTALRTLRRDEGRA